MSIRKEFVMKALAKELSIAELCRQYSVSRKTAYKWLARFKEQGIVGLANESSRPVTSPQKLSPSLEAEIVKLRQEHATWGSRKLRVLLLRTHGIAVPSESTIDRVLELAGLHRKRRLRPNSVATSTKRPAVVVGAPNDLWTVDFKGWWLTRDGVRCEPLTVRDAYSRYVLMLRTLGGTRYDHVKPAFERLFQRYGVPKAIQSDNGPPFACSTALGGLTKLSAWWVALGIHVVRSRPGCPQDNGGHERMHLDVCELQARPAANRPSQQTFFDQWVVEFNTVRPHEAIAMRTPSELYRPSQRRLPRLVVPSYPPHWKCYRVTNRGRIEYHGGRVYASTVLAGHLVGLELRGSAFVVWFHDLAIGQFIPGVHQSVQPLRENVTPHVTSAEQAPAATVTPSVEPPMAVTSVLMDSQLKPETNDSGLHLDGGPGLW